MKNPNGPSREDVGCWQQEVNPKPALTPKQAIEILERTPFGQAAVSHLELADVIKGLVKDLLELKSAIIQREAEYGKAHHSATNALKMNGRYMTEQTQKEINDSKLTPEQAIEILKRMEPDIGLICFEISDLIRDLAKK